MLLKYYMRYACTDYSFDDILASLESLDFVLVIAWSHKEDSIGI
jgi:hypothetical protein